MSGLEHTTAPAVETDVPATPPSSALATSALIVAAAFIASRILGLAREVILAYRFGTTGEYDAYVAAFRVPDLLFLVIMAGSFGAAFVPVFAGFLARGDDGRAWRLASAVLTLAAIVVVVAALTAFVVAGPLVRQLVAPGLSDDDQQLTVSTMRILLLSPVFLGLGIAAKGILEAQDLFTLPAIAPLLYNVAIIVGAIAIAPSFGVEGVAASVVVGAILHLAIQLPGLVASGFRYVPSLDLSTPGLARVGQLLGPRLIGQAAFQLNFIVVTSLASETGEGRVAALNLGWQLLMLPHGVVALSISTVVFPTMARLYETGDLVSFRRMVGQALRPLIFFALPAAVILFGFRTAIVRTLFQLGAFNAESTQLVAEPLAILALGLLGYGLVEVLTRVFYAMHDTRTPVIAGIIIIGINIAVGWLFLDRFGHLALAMSLSLSTTYEAIILLAVLRARLGGITARDLGWLARVALATVVLIAVVATIEPALTDVTSPGGTSRAAQIAFVVFALGLAGGTYALAAAAAGVPELWAFLDRVSRRSPLLTRLGSRR